MENISEIKGDEGEVSQIELPPSKCNQVVQDDDSSIGDGEPLTEAKGTDVAADEVETSSSKGLEPLNRTDSSLTVVEVPENSSEDLLDRDPQASVCSDEPSLNSLPIEDDESVAQCSVQELPKAEEISKCSSCLLPKELTEQQEPEPKNRPNLATDPQSVSETFSTLNAVKTLPSAVPPKVEGTEQTVRTSEELELKNDLITVEVIELENRTLPCVGGVRIDLSSLHLEMAEAYDVMYLGGEGKIEDSKGRKVLILKPEVPGNHIARVTYFDGKKHRDVEFRFLVNQNPRKLWQINDPDHASSRYWKDLYAQEFAKDSKGWVLAASRRGRSHEQVGSYRDDDFNYWSDEANGIYLFAVADGAGSAKYSREGSRQVVQVVIDELAKCLTQEVWTNDADNETSEGKIAQLMVAKSYQAMSQLSAFCRAENAKLDLVEKLALKDFNTTLLLAAVKVTEENGLKVVAFSIGDGAMAWVEPENSELLSRPDSGEYAGQTRFLTTVSVWPRSDAEWEAFRKHRISVKFIPPCVARRGFLALMTDGVSDPFFETENRLFVSKAWDSFVLEEADVDEGPKSIQEILKNHRDEKGAKVLSGWLKFWSVGNHDDRTLVMFGLNDPEGPYFE